MILVKKNIHFALQRKVKDAEGRRVSVQVLIGLKVVLCNIYAPTKRDPQFFHEVNKVLGHMDGQIILAGRAERLIEFQSKLQFQTLQLANHKRLRCIKYFMQRVRPGAKAYLSSL